MNCVHLQPFLHSGCSFSRIYVGVTEYELLKIGGNAMRLNGGIFYIKLRG